MIQRPVFLVCLLILVYTYLQDANNRRQKSPSKKRCPSKWKMSSCEGFQDGYCNNSPLRFYLIIRIWIWRCSRIISVHCANIGRVGCRATPTVGLHVKVIDRRLPFVIIHRVDFNNQLSVVGSLGPTYSAELEVTEQPFWVCTNFGGEGVDAKHHARH